MDVLWALVFLTMILKTRKDRQKRDKRQKRRKTQRQTTSNKVREKTTIENINLYDA